MALTMGIGQMFIQRASVSSPHPGPAIELGTLRGQLRGDLFGRGEVDTALNAIFCGQFESDNKRVATFLANSADQLAQKTQSPCQIAPEVIFSAIRPRR